MAERERKYSAVVTAVERYLPDRIVTNSELEKTIDTSDTWIRERTGDTCRDDCRGLCHQCGQNLNDGQCQCVESKMDPRWESLAKLNVQQ